MAKQKTVVETRNGCDIEQVDESVESMTGRPMNIRTFRVLTTALPRRIIERDLRSLEEARRVADNQPPS